MDTKYLSKLRVNLTLLLASLVAIASFAGAFLGKTYSREVAYYAAQGIGQDLVNLFLVVPAFLMAALLSRRNNLAAWLVWTGALLYIIYSYLLYCFTVHFNDLFLVYCAILGLSFYLFAFAILPVDYRKIKAQFNEKISFNGLAGYLYLVAGLFGMLWLSEIIPALMTGTVPKSITENGQIVNAVHVLDLGLFLPAMVIGGRLLQKKRPFGYFLAPSLLVFSVFMALAIAGMMLVMKAKGLVGTLGFLGIFGCLTLISLSFFLNFVNSTRRSSTRE